MFRESSKIKQQSVFGPISSQLGAQVGSEHNNPKARHNMFCAEVTAQIEEKLFKPLFSARRVGVPSRTTARPRGTWWGAGSPRSSWRALV